MELVSNLAWFAVCCLLLSGVFCALLRRRLRTSARMAFTSAALVCVLLLPVISMTDDLLEHSQAALPLAAQTWHLASEGASVGIELLPTFLSCLLLLCAPLLLAVSMQPERKVRSQAAWLMRSLRLRPPPFVTI